MVLQVPLSPNVPNPCLFRLRASSRQSTSCPPPPPQGDWKLFKAQTGPGDAKANTEGAELYNLASLPWMARIPALEKYPVSFPNGPGKA